MFKSYAHLIPDSMRKDYPDAFQELVKTLDDLQANAEANARALQSKGEDFAPQNNGMNPTFSKEYGAVRGNLNLELDKIAEKLERDSRDEIEFRVRTAHAEQQAENKRKKEVGDELSLRRDVKEYEKELIEKYQKKILKEKGLNIDKGKALGELRASGQLAAKDAPLEEKISAYGLGETTEKNSPEATAMGEENVQEQTISTTAEGRG